MNYLSILILVLVVLILLRKKQFLCMDMNDKKYITHIKEDLSYINKTNLSEQEILDKVKGVSTKYVIIHTDELNYMTLNNVLYNFYKEGEKTCGFNACFKAKENKNILKRLLNELVISSINYMQVLKKGSVCSYHIICSKTDEFLKDKIIGFKIDDNITKEVPNSEIKKHILNLDKLNIKNSFSILLTIIAGTLITANTVYTVVEVINFRASIYEVATCILIYICYANITSFLYSSIGIFKFISSYFFPIYIVLYILLNSYYYIKRVFEGVFMKDKKNFLIALLILFGVYILFILLKK